MTDRATDSSGAAPHAPSKERARVSPEQMPVVPRWRVRGREVALDRPIVFGVLNVTPDSFSDGGEFYDPQRALVQAALMMDEGADGLDIGGESTRPQGAVPVSEAEELQRVLPVLKETRARYPDALISVDTVKSSTARAALDAGADIINDVSGFRLDPVMGDICASAGAGVILMHSRGGVSEMGTYAHAKYDDVVSEVRAELSASLQAALHAGVGADHIVLDPGIGFAKRSEHSLTLLASLPALVVLGRPLVVGVSRKRFIGEITGVTRAAGRVHGTTGANVYALTRGARLFRVHDVRAAREALDVAWAAMRHERARESGPTDAASLA